MQNLKLSDLREYDAGRISKDNRRMLKRVISKYSTLVGVLMCLILCSITLFMSSNCFVNKEIIPKWLGMMLSIGIMGMAWSMSGCTISLPAKLIDTVIIFCFLLFIIRGISLRVAIMYPVGLLLLYYLKQYMVMVCQYKYLLGTVIILTLGLSLYGIFQYIGLLPSNNSIFVITGSFDNPAGFAASLACVLPLCFLFFNRQYKYLRCMTIMAVAIIATAIFLSGSRAGILSIMIAMVAWLFVRLKIVNKRSKILLTVALVVLFMTLYFLKKDSADGRLLIWRCTLDMVADKPILGHGIGAFQAKYMLYQADYINTHPDSRYAQLADNVLHPFNEYLLVLCEHGIVGLSLVALLLFLIVTRYRHNRSCENLPAFMSLLSLSVFSFFSYPFKYPFVWVILFLDMAIIFYNPNVNNHTLFFSKQQSMIIRNIPRISMLFLSLVLLTYTVMQIRAETKWKKIAYLSLDGKTREILPEYDKLYRWLGKNWLFLYNHAAELHEVKEYERSIAVFSHCTRYYNDMDVQMLLADNYKQLGEYAEAELHLKTAADMCPIRFMPLYELVKLYYITGYNDKALYLAKKIVEKEVKVESSTVIVIKNEMRKLLEVQESGDRSALYTFEDW